MNRFVVVVLLMASTFASVYSSPASAALCAPNLAGPGPADSSISDGNSSNNNGNSSHSNQSAGGGSTQALVGCGSSAPTVPSSISPALTSTNGSIAVSWGASSVSGGTPIQYKLEESVNGGAYTQITSIIGLQYTRTGLGDGAFRYRVMACNSGGCSGYRTASADSLVRLLPSVPGAANPTTTTDTNNVTVSWTAVTHGTYYDIQKRNNAGAWATGTNGATGTSGTVSGLTDGSWDFRIRACNTYSWSCSSYGVDGSSVTWRAIPSVPAAPTGPSTSTGSAAISWVKPSGTVTYYDLQKRLNNAGSWMTGKNGDTNTSETLSGLTDGLWDFQVRACNGYSWACSAYSAASSDTTVRLVPATPGAANPTTTTDTNNVTVSWTAVTYGTYYDIQKRNNAGTWVTGTNGATGTSGTISGLTDGSWDFRIRACNTYSWACSSYGVDGSSVTWRAIPSVPAAPTGPSTSTGSAAISWVKPAGTVTYYDLQKRLNNAGSWMTGKNGDTDTSETLSGLTDGLWDFQVRACNGYSWACSAYSAASSDTTVRLVPATPGAANPTTSTDTDNVTVSWTAVTYGTYYDIQKRNNAGTWVTGTNGATGTSGTVSSFTDGSWDFRIRACNTYSWACSSYGVDGSSVTWRAKPGVPGAPTLPTSDVDGAYSVSWTAATGTLTYYELQERVNNAGSWTTIYNSGTSLTQALSGRSDGLYDYQVRACNGYSWACSAYSAVSGDVNVLHVPGASTSLTNGTQDTDGSFSVSWTAGSGTITEYRLEEQKNSGTWVQVSSGSTGLSKSLSARGNGNYLYRVRACNASGCSGYRNGTSTMQVAILPAVPAAPGVPTTSTGSAAITWSSVTNATYYDLQKRNNSGTWVTAKAGDTDTSETVNGLTDGSWDFQVRACNTYSWSCSSYSGASTATVVRLVPSTPAAPTGPATDIDGSYAIAWVKPAGTVTVYDVQERVNSGSWALVANDTTQLSLTVSGRTTGNYDYRVRACNQYSWACSSYSAQSGLTEERRIPAVPVLTLSSNIDGDVKVNWSAVSEATYYEVQSLIPGGTWSTKQSSNSTSYSTTENTTGAYSYKVRACNVRNWACSAFSSALSVSVVIAENWDRKASATVANKPLISPTVPPQEENVAAALPGQGGVSGGQASYNIPIAVPPGRNGMQPNISINYSSQGGNGTLGMGWSVSAGGAISRCGQTVAQDGVNRGVQFDATNDRLCFKGSRLVLVEGTTYGLNGSIYRTEMDGFTRIIQNSGGINGTGTWFKVEYKNGQIEEYGNTVDSRVVPEGAPATLSWLLNKVSDRANTPNYMRYIYQNFGEGEFQLSEIQYTSSNSRRVTFNYMTGTRTDISSSFIAGGKIRQSKLLESISTYYETDLVREYKFTFKDSTASSRALLNSVEVCAPKNGINFCLAPTTMNWLEAEHTFTLEKLGYEKNGQFVEQLQDKVWSRDPSNDIGPRGDADGDGVPDWPTWKMDADGVWKEPNNDTLKTCSMNPMTFTRYCVSADFDKDGKTDNWKAVNNKLYVQYSRDGIWINTPITVGDNEFIANIGDYNGDGWSDIVIEHVDLYTKAGSFSLYLHSGNKQTPYINNAQGIYTTPVVNNSPTASLSFMGDLDGDGLPDLMVNTTQHPTISQAGALRQPIPETIKFSRVDINGSIYFDSLDVYSMRAVSFADASTNFFNYFMDVNGDGLQDWMAWDETNRDLKLRINQGKMQFGDWQAVSGANFLDIREVEHIYDTKSNDWNWVKFPKYNSGLRQFDIDADGRPDLLVPGTRLVKSCAIVFDYKKGTTRQEDWLCGDELYGHIDNSSLAGEQFEAIDSDLKDNSIYKFNVVKFTENADGSFTASMKDSGLVGSATQTVAVDAYGNGLTDFVFPFGCKLGEGACQYYDGDSPEMRGVMEGKDFGVYINRNHGSAQNGENYQPTDMLQSVENGFGVLDSWDYKPLTSRAPDEDSLAANDPYHKPFYARDDDYLDNSQSAEVRESYAHFGSSMYVVNEYQHSNGLGNELNTTSYRYKGAMANTQGRGFQGFRTIIVNDHASQMVSRSDFHQIYPLSGQLYRSYQWRADEVVSDDVSLLPSPLSESQFSWQFWPTVSYGGKSGSYSYQVSDLNTSWATPSIATPMFVGLKSQSSSNRDNDNRYVELKHDQSINEFDDWGNVVSSEATRNNGFSTVKSTTVNTLTNDENSWWIGKLENSTASVETLTGSGVWNSSLDSKKQVYTTYTYYASSRLPDVVTTTPQLGGGISKSVDTDYNAYGLPTLVSTYRVSSNKRSVSTTYTADSYFVETITNDLGHTASTVTDAATGLPLSVTNANNLTSITQYDAFGRPEQVTPPAGTGQPSYSRITWCNAGCGEISGGNSADIVYKATSYSAGQPETSVFKDKFNRALYSRTLGFDGSPIYTRVEYDGLGRKVFESVPSFDMDYIKGTHYTVYDEISRLTAKTIDQPAGQQLDVSYSYNQHQTQISANGILMYRTLAGDGKLIQTIDAMNGVTQYAYDAMGNPIILQDANGNGIMAEYNALGQKLYVDDPNMGHKSFTYSDFGEVASETDANGDTYSYHYDKLGRMDYRDMNGSREANFVFDNAAQGNTGLTCRGLPASDSLVNSSSFARSISYDNYCRPITTTTTIDGEAFSMSSQYDDNYGRVKAVTYPNNLTVSTDYNDLGYAAKTINAKSGYVYNEVTAMDPRLNWIAAKAANGIIDEVRDYAAETGQMNLVFAQTSALQQQRHRIAYTYNSFGDLETQAVEMVASASSSNIVSSFESYTYDDLHRLTESTRNVDGVAQLPISYDYDAVGNFTSKSDYTSAYTYGNGSKSLGGNAGPNAVRTVNKISGGTASFSYDLNGNLTSGDGRTISYNAFNKPISISKGGITSQFFYGSDQMRYKQVKSGLANGQETTLYLGKAYEEIRYNGEVQKKLYIGDTIITETTGGSNPGAKIGFVHRDRLESVVTITDENGNVVDNKSFDPFGKPRDADMSTSADSTLRDIAMSNGFITQVDDRLLTTRRGFTDHEHLDDFDLIHMNGRVYDYNLGRFLSVDPLIQKPGNSQSMNPYSYILNNPLAGTDPSGYSIEEITKKVTVDVAGSRFKSTVTVTAKTDDKGNVSFSVSGGSSAAQSAVSSALSNSAKTFGFVESGKGGSSAAAASAAGASATLGNDHRSNNTTVDNQVSTPEESSGTSVDSVNVNQSNVPQINNEQNSNDDEPIFIKGKPKDIESEGKLTSFRLTVTPGDINLSLNTVVTDGKGGMKIQISNVYPKSNVELMKDVTKIHEGQHLKDMLAYGSNLEILKDQPSDLLVRVTTKVQNVLERRAYRAGFNYLQQKLAEAKTYEERLYVDVAIKSYEGLYKSYED